MLNVAVTLICALFFLASGSLIQGIKRLFQIFITLILKILSLLGIEIKKREGRIKISKEFKNTFKDIKIVRRSKQNNKIKPSINIIALSIFIISLALIIINLDVVSGNIVSKWLYTLKIEDIKIASLFLIGSQKDMDIVFTAAIFSMVSFSSSKLLSQWKETSKSRQAKKEMRLKKSAINLMTSKELLDAAKNKDREKFEQLSAIDNNNIGKEEKRD